MINWDTLIYAEIHTLCQRYGSRSTIWSLLNAIFLLQDLFCDPVAVSWSQNKWGKEFQDKLILPFFGLLFHNGNQFIICGAIYAQSIPSSCFLKSSSKLYFVLVALNSIVTCNSFSLSPPFCCADQLGFHMQSFWHLQAITLNVFLLSEYVWQCCEILLYTCTCS